MAIKAYVRADAARRFALSSLAYLAATILLFACGGGGGGGSPPPAPQPTLALSTDQLTFTAASSALSVPPQVVSGTVTGVTSGTLYVLIVSTGPAVLSISLPNVSGSSAQSTVTPAPPATLGPGTFTSRITVTACLNDPTCATGQIAGSRATVNVTYQIDGPLISPSPVALTSVEGTSSAPIALSLSRPAGSSSWSTVTSYPQATPGFLTVTPATGASLPATLSFSASPQPAGNYSATTTVTTPSGLSLPIPVT